MKGKLLILFTVTFLGCAQHSHRCYEIDGAKLKIRVYKKDLKDKLKVEALSFESMDLHALPDDLPEFKNLRYLNLRRNNFKIIPAYVTRFPNLAVLFIDHNPIELLPKEIVEMKNLRVLTINQTEIQHLPKGFYDLNLKLFLIGGAKIDFSQREEVRIKMKKTKVINSLD